MGQSAVARAKSTALAADGAGDGVVTLTSPGIYEVDVFVGDSTTWGSGTLTLQVSPDGGTTWVSTGSSWTSGTGRLTSSGPIAVGAMAKIRVNLSGSTSPSITPNIVVRRVSGSEPVVNTFTADATGTSFLLNALPDTVGVYMYGTWGSGTMKFQCSPDGGATWYTIHSKTSNDYTKVANLREGLYRFVLSGSTSPALTCLVV